MGRTFCSADWHAQPHAWEIVSKFLSSDDTLYYLGDVTGRGAGDGWDMLKQMLCDPRVIYICGNHDRIVADAVEEGSISYLAHINGEASTVMSALGDDPVVTENMPKRIRRLPLWAVYCNKVGKKIYMSHSGSTDISDEHELLWDRLEYLTKKNYTEYDYVIHGHTRAQHIKNDLGESAPEYTGGAYWYSDWRATVDCGTILTNQIVLLDLDTFEEEIFEF